MRTVLLFTIAAIATYLAAAPAMADTWGDWNPVDVKDLYTQNIARWAVNEHVKQSHDVIKFKKLLSGRVRLGHGVIYDLIIDASNGDDKDAKYEAELQWNDYVDTYTLLSFKPAK